MSLRELVHRTGELATMRRLRREHGATADGTRAPRRDPATFAFCASTHARLPALPWASPFGDDSPGVEDVLAGRWPAMAFDWRWRPGGECWHSAPDTGRLWPRTFFGAIPYLEGNPVGDVRVAWEPSRLQQLVALALIARDGAPDVAARAVAQLEDQLTSWVEANPPLTGIHYISVMECAQRVLASCHALDLIRDRLTRPDDVWRALLTLVESHARLIEQRLSLYSSAGNHTITECAGLVYAGTLFPELAGAARWRARGLAVLTREARRQVLPDGGGAEQSFRYLLLIVDLIGLVVRVLEHDGEAPPATLVDAFDRGSRFLSEFADRPSGLPRIGDSDDGFALSRYLRLAWREAGEPPASRTWPDAGYTRLRGLLGDARATVLVDHGPLGMAPAYAHAHADALSVTLSLGSESVLIDPGTFSYTGMPEWREYFRSTRAHNTVTVDGSSQAIPELTFMWRGAGRTEVVHSETGERGTRMLLARHAGYERIGVTHHRAIVVLDTGALLIWDRLTGTGTHALDLHWHTPATAERTAPERVALHPYGVDLGLAGGELSIHRGSEAPKLGWLSPRYGQRVPASVLLVRHTGGLPHEFTTIVTRGDVHVGPDVVERYRESLRERTLRGNESRRG